MLDTGFINMGGLAGAINSERESDLDYEHLYEGDAPPDDVLLADIPIEGTPAFEAGVEAPEHGLRTGRRGRPNR